MAPITNQGAGPERQHNTVTYDARTGLILTVNDVLSPQECESLIAFAEGVGFADAPITTSHGFIMAKDIRDNTRVMVDDPERAHDLWRRLEAVIPKKRGGGWTAIGLNERLRFYRYEPGQRFAWHRDGAFAREVELVGQPKRRERSHLTLLLYLNDGFEGGETEIDLGTGECSMISPVRGGALLFAHHLRHQGVAVRRGRKYVLRSDVMYVHDGATFTGG